MHVPSTSATAVAPKAAWSEVSSAERIPGSAKALRHQSSVNSVIGQRTRSLPLNEYRTITPIGT